LQLAAIEVALDAERTRIRVLTLRQLTSGKRKTGVRQRPDLLSVLTARQQRKGAREEEVACRGGRRSACRGIDRWAAPAPLRPVEDIVMDEARHVDELHSRSGACERIPVRAARVVTADEDEQRAKALSASVKSAARRALELAAVRRRDLDELGVDMVHQLAHGLAA